MKKKVLIIDGPLGGGGAERVLIDILRHFDYDRYEVDLAVICRGGALMDEVPPQVNVIELWDGYTWDYKLGFRLSRLLHCNWLFSRKMNGRRLRRDYDVEISFLEGMPTKLGALRTTSARKVAWVHADIYTHRYEAGQFFPGEEIRAYNKMDCVVNVSKDCEDAFRRRFPECTARLRVIYNPIDREKIVAMSNEPIEKALPEKKVGENSLIVMALGRLTQIKNPERFAEVARLAKASGTSYRFVWVGDGDRRAALEELIERYSLRDTVEIYGYASNPYPVLKKADVLMVTSDSESFCLAICEAMCLGVPVVSVDSAGPAEIIGDNEYGVLTDHSAESMFAVLRRWVENPAERMAYAEKALRRPDNYSVENTLSSIYSLIEN